MTDIFTEKTIVECKCGQKLRAPADRGMIKLRCPKCGAQFGFTPPITLQANGWFERGTNLLELKRYEEALVCFGEARRLRHPQSLGAIALCQKKLGRTAPGRLFAWGEKADDVGPP